MSWNWNATCKIADNEIFMWTIPPIQFGSILFWVNCGTWPRNAVQLTVIHHAHIPYSPYSIYRLFPAPYWNCFSHLSASFELILEINVQSWQLSSRRINLNWIDNLLRLFKLAGSVSECVCLSWAVLAGNLSPKSLSLCLEFTFTLSRTFVCQLGLAAAKLCGFGFLWAQVNLSFSLAHKMGILCALLLLLFFSFFHFGFCFHFSHSIYIFWLCFFGQFSRPASQPTMNFALWLGRPRRQKQISSV